jgi:putative transposase
MARGPRLEVPGVPLHIVQRGNNRAACFPGDAERHLYLRCLFDAAARRGCDVHAYVLMTNHVHLLATPRAAAAASRMMQDVGRRYVQIINRSHARTGTLWEGRFKSSLVDTERYFFTCHRYIELNPVRAGIAGTPGAYPWSSHRYYIGMQPDKLVVPHALFLRLAPDTAERSAAFRRMFQDPVSATDLERIRTALNTGAALGSEKFLDDMGRTFGRLVRPPSRGRPRKSVKLQPVPDNDQENLF